MVITYQGSLLYREASGCWYKHFGRKGTQLHLYHLIDCDNDPAPHSRKIVDGIGLHQVSPYPLLIMAQQACQGKLWQTVTTQRSGLELSQRYQLRPSCCCMGPLPELSPHTHDIAAANGDFQNRVQLGHRQHL